jgi:hypothetical protein
MERTIFRPRSAGTKFRRHDEFLTPGFAVFPDRHDQALAPGIFKRDAAQRRCAHTGNTSSNYPVFSKQLNLLQAEDRVGLLRVLIVSRTKRPPKFMENMSLRVKTRYNHERGCDRRGTWGLVHWFRRVGLSKRSAISLTAKTGLVHGSPAIDTRLTRRECWTA